MLSSSAKYTCIVGRRHEISQKIINEMYSERKRCLVDQMGWDLQTDGNLEIDQFDRFDTEYIIVLDNGFHAASARIHYNQIKKSLINNISSGNYDDYDHIWEVSRFISSNFSFSTSEYILFFMIQKILNSKFVDKVYLTAEKRTARLYRMFGLSIRVCDKLNLYNEKFGNYYINTNSEAFEGFMRRAPERDLIYLRELGRKWEVEQMSLSQIHHYALLGKPRFIAKISKEESLNVSKYTNSHLPDDNVLV